jgi:uncharacterized protein
LVIIPMIVTIAAISGIFWLNNFSNRLKFSVHKDQQIDSMLKFQSMQMVLTLVVLVITYLLNPGNFITFFRIGEISEPTHGVNWLGIPPGMAWSEVAATMGFWITVATGIFMFIQLKQANAKINTLPAFMPWVMLFSALNAFAEESIFRIGIVSPLYGQFSVPVVILISAILFGVPHYFGMPKGIIGALMAGFLGWLLAMSVIETHGLFLAWAVHFAQDVIIIASMLMIGHSKKADQQLLSQL